MTGGQQTIPNTIPARRSIGHGSALPFPKAPYI